MWAARVAWSTSQPSILDRLMTASPPPLLYLSATLAVPRLPARVKVDSVATGHPREQQLDNKNPALESDIR